jgi:hypothetical protein
MREKKVEIAVGPVGTKTRENPVAVGNDGVK